MGIFISYIIMLLWGGHLYYLLAFAPVDYTTPWFYLHIIIQAYLYTGLFITAHDAMHGTVSRSPVINRITGIVASFLFAGLSYKRLKTNHFKHHKLPATEEDPDYYTKSQSFFPWFFVFMKRYTTVIQIIIMAAAYNILKIWVRESALWFFWIIPALLGTLQLFYFGTYRPHRKPHAEDMEPHKARTQRKNHLWAMVSCYFFGYHYEHHDGPHIPWWKLHSTKK